MSLRKLGGAVAGMAAVATLSTGTAAMAAPADGHADAAAPQCTVTLHLQARVSLTKSTTKVPVKITGCAGRLFDAVAALNDPQHHQWSDLGWDEHHRSHNAIFKISDAPPRGTYKIAAQNGSSTDHQQIIWGNDPSTVVRLGSKASISTSRKGSKVTISSKVSHFSGSGWKAYTHKTVGFQIRAVGSKKWKTIGFGKTSSTGRVSLRHTAAHSAYYRVSVSSTNSYWGSISGSSRR